MVTIAVHSTERATEDGTGCDEVRVSLDFAGTSAGFSKYCLLRHIIFVVDSSAVVKIMASLIFTKS